MAAAEDHRLLSVGLTAAEVASRVAAGLGNSVPFTTSRSFLRILQANLFTLFNAIVGGSFVVLLVLGYWQDALFGFFIIANVLIGVVQEFRAKRTLDNLALLHSPRARVLRDGVVVEIAPADVVMDDALVLRAGDQIPADAVVLSSTGLEVDESLLTGEADPVLAGLGREIWSGSTVVGGFGTARVMRVGTDSYANTLTEQAREFSLVRSELRESLARVIRWISWALLPVSALVINGQMQAVGGWGAAIASGAWREAFVLSTASLISMIPQGLVFITSVAFAVGALKLSRRNVLVQELAAVEGLARVDVICFDKTGTLTEGTLELNDVEPVVETASAAAWSSVLGWFGADRNANATARALSPRFTAPVGVTPASSVMFSSGLKWGAVSFADDAASFTAVGTQPGTLAGTWVLGAPEIMIAGGAQVAASATERLSYLADAGFRTLLLAHSDVAPGVSIPPTSTEPALQPALEPALPPALHAVAIVTFREKVRADAAETIRYFREEGVTLRVLSGDHPRTVAAVARSVGLDVTGEAFDARTLPTDPAELSAVLERHQIFGRVSSAQKKDIVIALQRAGHVVAMTGDGVNDALALKQADMGVAMGSGAAATRAVSRIVLLDGQFSHLPHVVAEGRKVTANIERLSKLFLTKTVYAMLFAIIFGLLLWEFPFLPRQLSAVDGLTIGLPALVLALLPNTRRYLPGFLKRAAVVCLPFGAVTAAAVIGVVHFARLGGFTATQTQSAATITITLIGLWVLVVLMRPLDRVRFALIGGMYVALAVVFLLPILSNFFLLAIPPLPLLETALIAATAGSVLIEITHRVLVSRATITPQRPA
jgi:cation-transporting ATPase E